MEKDPYARGVLRKIKFNIIAGIVLIILVTIINLIACTPRMEIKENEEPPFIVDDWKDNPDTIITKPDSVRDMTHADSIRFGLISPDK